MNWISWTSLAAAIPAALLLAVLLGTAISDWRHTGWPPDWEEDPA